MGGGGGEVHYSAAQIEEIKQLQFKANTKERGFDYSNVRNNPVQFLKDIGEKNQSYISDITTFQEYNPGMLQINNLGRFELTDKGIQSFRDQGVDYSTFNKQIKDQYLAFYSPEVGGNVIGSLVNNEFVNERVSNNSLIGYTHTYIGGHKSNKGFLVDTSDDGFTYSKGHGFGTESFRSTNEINKDVDAYKSEVENSITFERATTNIFTNASKERIIQKGEVLTSNILTGASIRAGTDKAKELLKTNEK